MLAGQFAAVFAALYAAHHVGDFWVQTPRQVAAKGMPGWSGRVACAEHVATYTVTALVALLALEWATGWQADPWPTIAALCVSAVTHYIADRRTPLRRIADWLGKDAHWLDHGGGMLHLDQAWHVCWLFVAALIAA